MLNQPGLRALNLQKARLLERVANVNPELAAQVRNLKLEWYAIKNSTDGDSTDVFIYDEIGGSFGVDASAFVQELNEISTPQIVVRINSPGGLLTDGLAIAASFQQHPSHIITRVDSMAASAASIIAVSGDVVEMVQGSQMMIHDAIINVQANPAELAEMFDWLTNQSNNIADFYARKAGGTTAEWRARMQAETWMFAGEAVDMHLADRMYVSPKRQPQEEETDVDPVNSALHTLMNRKHRITNRGYRYNGRNNAPDPAEALRRENDLVTLAKSCRDADTSSTVSNTFGSSETISSEDFDRFIATFQKTLGG